MNIFNIKLALTISTSPHSSLQTPQGLFTINPASGEVTLQGQLDYETEKFYQLEIMAADGGVPPLNSTTDLIILVGDVQDTSPFFLNLPYMAEVYENASVVRVHIEI